MSDRTGVPRRILLVAYFYPPMTIIGARRPHALARWLGRRGHEVTVLTSVHAGRRGGDPAIPVHRSRDLLATQLNWRRENFEVVTGQRAGSWTPGPGPWGSIFVPDVQLLSWMPFAVGAARRLHRSTAFDAVITTSPVESAHLVGLALSRQKVAWIADLRDGWRFEPVRNVPPLAAQRRFDDLLERTALRRADAVVTVSEPISADLRRRHGTDVTTITNGFDPEDITDALPAPGTVNPHKLTFAYTGALGTQQSLEPLLEAMARLARGDPRMPERVELVVAGAQTEQQRLLYARPQYAPFVRHVGFVAREEAMALQRAADVLVLVTSGVRTSEATGKLYEYLAAGRPILVIGAGSAAADIVAGAGAGTVIPVHDPDAAEETLRAMLASPPQAPSPQARDPFAYPVLAARYEEVLERAIARRRAH